MDRSIKVVIGAGVIVGVVVLAAFSVGLLTPANPKESPEFTWITQTNDTLTYQITVYRGIHFTSESIPRYDNLNHTFITLNITSLVDVQEIDDESQFTMMVETEKVSILLPVLHENGSEITVPDAELIRGIVSKCILPVGGWSFVDDYYYDLDDPGDYSFSCNTYFSFIESDSFVFGHVQFNIDAGKGWHSTMNTTTGLPSIIDWWNRDFIIHRDYQIVMTLIPS